MPPKVLYAKEEIVDAGLVVVRKEGLEALTARRVATELSCTVRPIYHHFRSMGELKNSVLARSGKLAVDFLLSENAESPFLGLLLGYVHLAQQEPHIFKSVYMTKNDAIDYHNDRIAGLIDRIRQDPDAEGLTDEQLLEVNLNTWIYSHGISTLLSTGALKMSTEDIKQYLANAAHLFLEQARERD